MKLTESRLSLCIHYTSFLPFFFEGPYYPAQRLFCNLTASCVQNCDLELIEVTFMSTIIG